MKSTGTNPFLLLFLVLACLYQACSEPLPAPLHCPANSPDIDIIRGPYVQQLSNTGVILRWRTATQVSAAVLYQQLGSDSPLLAYGPATTEHVLALKSLQQQQAYGYEICGQELDTEILDTQHFITAPAPRQPFDTRIWVIGDSGSANPLARQVYDAYLAESAEQHTDVWLMLGDNAYPDGTDEEYQRAVFKMYPEILPNTALWPVLGNHDARSVHTPTQTGVYYNIFSIPTEGQVGGVASRTEAYYSFDYGDIHFVALDSQDSDNSPGSPMLRWLEDDLKHNTALWTIAFMHHPPYTKGTHDSDTEVRHVLVRENMVPILEKYDVDLVLAGHSHVYERSRLIQGHTGFSDSYNSTTHEVDGSDGNPDLGHSYVKSIAKTAGNGTVYAVVGSSGNPGAGSLDHPANLVGLAEMGSMVIEIRESSLEARFLHSNGSTRDRFRIEKQ